MKSLNWKLFTVATTLAIAATTASAQTVLKASIPFSFTAGASKVMQAGDYAIRDGGNAWFLTSLETRHTGMAMPVAPVEGRTTAKSELVFHCRDNGCRLAAIHVARGQGAEFREPKGADAQELTRVVIIPIDASKSL